MRDDRSRSATVLWRCARTLRPRRRLAKGLPRLFFFTDPARTPDPSAAVARLPRGSGVVYRAFGAAGAEAAGRRLARIAHRRGLVLLAGADPALAVRIGADGVHLPERLAHRAAAILRGRPRWIVTCAAHSAAAVLRAARAGADAAVVSPVFESASPSAGRPIGVVRFAALAGAARLPVIALGGLSARTAPRLLRSGAAGLGAVEALAGGPDAAAPRT